MYSIKIINFFLNFEEYNSSCYNALGFLLSRHDEGELMYEHLYIKRNFG